MGVSEANVVRWLDAALSSDPLKNLDEPARGSPLPHCWYDGQTLSQNNPTDLLDRGCVSRRRNLTL